jgi:hypothetical protein
LPSGEQTTPGINQEGGDHLEIAGVDHRDGVAGLRRHVDPTAIGAQGHPFRLDPHHQRGDHLLLPDVGHRRRARVLVGGEESGAVAGDHEPLGIGADVEALNLLEGAGVERHHGIGGALGDVGEIAQRHVEPLAVGGELDAPGPGAARRHRDGRDHAVGSGVEDGDRSRLLVGDVRERSGDDRSGGEQEEEKKGFHSFHSGSTASTIFPLASTR